MAELNTADYSGPGSPIPDDPWYAILRELAAQTGILIGESELPAVVRLYREYIEFARSLDGADPGFGAGSMLGLDVAGWLASGD